MLAFLAELPAAKRQPNLLFAAAGHLLGGAPGPAALRALLSRRRTDLAGTMMTRYDYDGHRVHGTDPDAPVLECQPRGPVPLPARVPEVAWRAGLDLNPLDVTSDDDVRWLECLIWPGETGRQERLRAAIETARRDPPPLYQGDLLTDVPDLIRQAPADATVVIYHSAVLAYVRRADRAGFARTIGDLGPVWLSNEGAGVLPGIAVPGHDAHGFVLV